MAAPPTLAQLTQSLASQSLPTPTSSFLTPILTPTSATQRLPPLSALTATARHRLLAADYTTPSLLSPSTSILPLGISDPKVQASTLQTDIHVQVLDILDLGKSKWEQIELLEAERKGETTKGREIIRVVPGEEGAPSTAATQVLGTQPQSNISKGPFKLLLQDCKGYRVWGFEVKRVERIGYPPAMGIGAKILLRKGGRVARGMVLLEPMYTLVLGGKIEGLDKAWREGREQRLREEVQRDRGDMIVP